MGVNYEGGSRSPRKNNYHCCRKDTVGIIARVCTYLAENNVNVLDLTQTSVRDFQYDDGCGHQTTVQKAQTLPKLGNLAAPAWISAASLRTLQQMHRI